MSRKRNQQGSATMNLPSATNPDATEPTTDEVVKPTEEFEAKPINDGLPIMDKSPFGSTPIGQPRNLDSDYYQHKYQDMKLMWVNDIGGDVQRWINQGAEPVAVENQSGKNFEGLTDVVDSKWVRAIGGENKDGSSFWVYLLKIDPEVYDRVKLAPERARQKAINDSMYGGQDQSESKSGLKSYAPNLPTGDTGMNVAHEVQE